ncbi:DnaA/Hda family protein, partial [uncultured Psychrobacter sp.]
MIDTANIWDKCLNDLRYNVKDNVFTMWLRPLSAHQEAQTLIILAPNDYFVTYIKKNHLQDIQQLVTKHSQGSIEEVVVRVDNAGRNAEDNSQSGSLFVEDDVSPTPSEHKFESIHHNNAKADIDANMRHNEPVESADTKSLSYLNPEFTFETFVTGKSNNLAYKACYELGKRQSKNRHNPLFIYGPSGLGKTHLMHSVAHRYLKNNQSFYYFTSEKFINQLVYSLRNNKIEDFKKKIKKVDLLIVDDIHV